MTLFFLVVKFARTMSSSLELGVVRAAVTNVDKQRGRTENSYIMKELIKLFQSEIDQGLITAAEVDFWGDEVVRGVFRYVCRAPEPDDIDYKTLLKTPGLNPPVSVEKFAHHLRTLNFLEWEGELQDNTNLDLPPHGRQYGMPRWENEILPVFGPGI